MRDIIDKKQVSANLERARRIAGRGSDFLLRRVLDELSDRLGVVSRSFDTAVALGPYAEATRAVLEASGKVSSTGIADFDAHETLDLKPQSVDLAVSLLHLHLINDVPGGLIQIRRALKPDGLFLGCIPAAGTLSELRASLLEAEMTIARGASPRVLPFIDVREAGGLLQRAGLAMPVADGDEVMVRYDNAFDLMRELRAMGATNALMDRRRLMTSRQVFVEAAARYSEHFADADGRIRATFGFVWLSGWAPAPGQPKPLKPGSATHSLAAVLGSDKNR